MSILPEQWGSALRSALLFLVLVIVYFCWMTGFTLRFSETSVFPSYNMLARSFLKGQLNIDENPPVDYLTYNGKRYLYFAPGPAVFHLPSLIFAGKDTPTGLVVIIFMAGAATIFYSILGLWRLPDAALGLERSVFVLVFAFNGYSLLIAAVPSIHHEAIAAAMFFLLVGLYYVLKCVSNDFQLGFSEALISGICFSMCVLSRFSYSFTVIVLVLVAIGGSLRNSRGLPGKGLLPLAVLVLVSSAGIVGTLVYNYLRFGSLGDFGVGYMHTLYRDYFLQGNYLRYDHIPYNVWDYFFRVPQLLSDFPYLGLPFHILETKSLHSAGYFLMHVNELSVSVFVLMPILFFCFFYCVLRQFSEAGIHRSYSRILSAAVVLQLIPLSLTIGSIARYYYDFVPLMLIMAFAGYVSIMNKFRSEYLMLGTSAAASIILSLPVPIVALAVYRTFINFGSPLLWLWFGIE